MTTAKIFSIADIIFEVKDKEHPHFRRDGIDLVHPVEIPLMTVSIFNLHQFDYTVTIYLCIRLYVVDQ